MIVPKRLLSYVPSRKLTSGKRPQLKSLSSSQRFIQASVSSHYHTSRSLSQEKIVTKDGHNEVIEIRGPKSAEYHRTSTRYNNTTREVLEALDHSDFSRMPHKVPGGVMDRIALKFVQFLRYLSDIYFKDNLVKRAVMLETVAAVPGMVAGMSHHLSSLRNLKNDNWIKTLLDEAENERMHLMTFLKVAKPTMTERLVIIGVQGIFFTGYLLAFILFPKTCHRFTGYLEEEAVKTYSKFLKQIDEGKVKNVKAPQIAIDYWNMPQDATLRDVVLVIRADEMDHRDVNHTLSDYIGKLRKREMEYNEINIDYNDLYSMDMAYSPESDKSIEDVIHPKDSNKKAKN